MSTFTPSLFIRPSISLGRVSSFSISLTSSFCSIPASSSRKSAGIVHLPSGTLSVTAIMNALPNISARRSSSSSSISSNLFPSSRSLSTNAWNVSWPSRNFAACCGVTSLPKRSVKSVVYFSISFLFKYIVLVPSLRLT